MADTAGTNGERKTFDIVGKPNIPGRLSFSIATGRAKFGTDVVVPNMLFAKFLRSPFGRARVKSLGISDAKALPGVVDIVTWEDPDIKAIPQIDLPLLIEEADMEDDEVAAVVVAESEEICDQALKLIKADWDVLPHILDPREGAKAGAPVLRANPKGTGNVQTTHISQGDVESGFKQADHIIEFGWTLSQLSSHLPNLSGGLAWWYEDPLGAEDPTLFVEGISPNWGGYLLRPMYKNIHGPESQSDPGIPPSFQMCVEQGRKAFNWQWHPAGARKRPDGRMHGLSFRYQMCTRHGTETYACTVTIQGDGKVYMPLKGPWCGVYSADACAMVVAEELGARIEDVILLYDPKAIFTPVGMGSDGTTASAWVAKEAAAACKKLLLDIAAPRFKAKPEDLDTRDSTVFLKSDPSKSLPFSEFPESGDHDKDIAATFTGRPPIAIWNIAQGRMLDTMNASFCEVAVDTETGLVEVIRYLVVCDPGKVLRPTSLESQIHQVMMFSDGAGLMEEFIYDKATGVKLHTNMHEYKKPTILDIGPCDTILVETRSGNAAYGASGISHAMATTQLIACAVANAIGKWIAPPLTPDRVLRALGKA